MKVSLLNPNSASLRMSKWSLPGRASWVVILSSFLRCPYWRQLRERTNTSQQNSGYTWIWTRISLFSKPGLLDRTGNCVYQEHLQAKEPKNQASESYSRTLQKVLSGHGAISWSEVLNPLDFTISLDGIPWNRRKSDSEDGFTECGVLPYAR